MTVVCFGLANDRYTSPFDARLYSDHWEGGSSSCLIYQRPVYFVECLLVPNVDQCI